MAEGKLHRLLADPAVPGLLRGEIWIQPEVWVQAGHPLGAQGRAALARELGADICFFPYPEAQGGEGAGVLAALAHGHGLDCGLILDGPFQRLASRQDLCALLGELAGHPRRFASRLEGEKERIRLTLETLEGAEADLILIGEDVGYGGGLYFAPEMFRAHLIPFYEELMDRFQGSGWAWGWHSDGQVESLLPGLVACGFQCFSLEPECVDLLAFKKRYGPQICLVGGIRADWLSSPTFDRDQEEAVLKDIGALIREGGLVLASACGLHHPSFLPNLRRLYRLFPSFRLASCGPDREAPA